MLLIHHHSCCFQGEPLEVSLTEETSFIGSPDYQQKCSYDLQSAALRQSQFYYNVCLPHYQDYQFLANAITRYKVGSQQSTWLINCGEWI